MTDKRALKILHDTYWTNGRWRSSPLVTPEDLSYAQGHGVMFAPIIPDHDVMISRLVTACRAIRVTYIANMFLSNLSTRRLELRSALGSYVVFRHLRPHPARFEHGACVICRMFQPKGKPEDINVLNFERFKWGGVRHDQPLYAAIDLELFLLEKSVLPTAKDIELFHAILNTIREVTPDMVAARLEANLPRSLKSDKAERDVLISILGFCVILSSVTHPNYRESFVPQLAASRIGALSTCLTLSAGGAGWTV